MNLRQPPAIDASVPSLVQFWHNGIRASATAVTYAVERGLSDDALSEVVGVQAPLLKLIDAEVSTFRKSGWHVIPGASSKDELSVEQEFLVRIFNEYVVTKELTNLCMPLQFMQSAGAWKVVRSVYRLTPALGALLRSVCDTRLFQIADAGVCVDVFVGSALRFVGVDAFERARAVFSNMLDGMIKCGGGGGTIAITMEGNDLIFKGDDRVMDTTTIAQLRKDIGADAEALGWKWKVTSKRGGGTSMRIRINKGSFISPAVAEKMGRPVLQEGGDTPFEDLTARIESFKGIAAFHGYTFVGNRIDISASPIFAAINSARVLMDRLVQSR